MGEEELRDKLKGAESYGSAEDVIDKEKVSNDKKKKKAIFVGAGTAVFLTAATAFFVLDGDDTVRNALSPNEHQPSSRILGNTVGGGDAKGENVKEEESSEISANVPEWSTTDMEYEKDNGDLRRSIFATYANSVLRANTYAMSSETNGYHVRGTMDSKSVNYTLEEYISSAGEYIERLINPTFGGWSEFQYSNSNASENFPVEDFDDMFSNEYKEKYDSVSPASYFPVYADWEGNDYNMKNLSNTARWHGEVKSIETDIENYGYFDEQTNITAEIDFSSWNEKGEKVEKQGVLQLVVIPGGSDERPLVVDDAVLTVR